MKQLIWVAMRPVGLLLIEILVDLLTCRDYERCAFSRHDSKATSSIIDLTLIVSTMRRLFSCGGAMQCRRGQPSGSGMGGALEVTPFDGGVLLAERVPQGYEA